MSFANAIAIVVLLMIALAGMSRLFGLTRMRSDQQAFESVEGLALSGIDSSPKVLGDGPYGRLISSE